MMVSDSPSPPLPLSIGNYFYPAEMKNFFYYYYYYFKIMCPIKEKCCKKICDSSEIFHCVPIIPLPWEPACCSSTK